MQSGQCSNDDRLNKVLCQTSAHSTLTIDAMNSSSSDGSRIARILSAEAGPTEGGLLAEAGHNGYEPATG